MEMTEQDKSSALLPETPELGPPASYFHGTWIGAPEEEAVEWYDELDAERWSIRCVRKFRDGSLRPSAMPAQTGAAKCRISLFLPWKRSTRISTFSLGKSRKPSSRLFGRRPKRSAADAPFHTSCPRG